MRLASTRLVIRTEATFDLNMRLGWQSRVFRVNHFRLSIHNGRACTLRRPTEPITVVP